MKGKNPPGRESKTPGKMWGIPKTPKEKLWGGWRSQRAREAVRATEHGPRPLSPIPRPASGLRLRPVTQEPRRPPFPMEQQRRLVGAVEIGSDDLLNPVAFSLHFSHNSEREESEWSIFVLETLVRVKGNERKDWRFPSPSVTSCFRAALSPPHAPRRTLGGRGLSARKGGEGAATQIRSEGTRLCIVSKLGLESPVNPPAPPPNPPRRCVLFKDTVEFRPVDSSVVSGVAENSPGHVSSLLFYW